MQTLRKKSPLKYRNEPARFFGDGVVFKAKLIGILEVGEARGDRMCQEALQDLKIAIRAAGEHKQRITIHVTIEGLRLRDEKTGESLYHHPVHKISFIAQDMTDSRAFGYIFGSPDCGHRFFGIKTDKAASQVVLAMRDLFQCVFELKKKEIELAKQHIQNRITAHEHQQIKSSILEHKKNTSLLNEAAATVVSRSTASTKPEKSPETTANLVDLEQELSSIQRGITQMERITPNEDVPITKNVLDDDPFGDSFTSFSSTTPFNILPPPSAATKKIKQAAVAAASSIIPNTSTTADDDEHTSSIIGKSSAITPPIMQTQQQQSSSLDSWLHSSSMAAKFSENDIAKIDEGSLKISRHFEDDDSNNSNLNTAKSELIDAFTDLDPLGKKTYVDKKYFFQDLKNPPKKVLKDLSEPESIFDAHFSPLKRQSEMQSFNLESLSSTRSHDESTKAIDPFEEEDFSKIIMDQMEPSVSTTGAISQKSIILPDTKINSVTEENKSKNEEKCQDYKGLSIDSNADSIAYSSGTYSDLKRQGSDSSTKNVFSVDSLSKKIPKPNLFGQRNVKRDSNGINMRRLQESDSLSENEPELPPRVPDSEPPPLPPKNQKDFASELSDKNRYSKTISSSRDSGSRYDYANKLKSYSSDSPPIPLPSRKINRAETSSSISKITKKSNDDEDYLTPNSSNNFDSIPQLPPPPPQKYTSKLRGPRKSDTDPKNLDAPTPPFTAKPESSANTIIPDITLSQLLTLGIDDLAQKLNVPPSKLNTMTLVELTTYLSEFIENSKHANITTMPSHAAPPIPIRPSLETPSDSPVFKVSFDDVVFEAKFDDNFGELQQQQNEPHEENASFVANFDNFNQAPASVIPTADRYAVFREIIDQEIQQQQQQHSFEEHHQESVESNNSNSLEEVHDDGLFDFTRTFESDRNQFESPIENQIKKSPNLFQNSLSSSKIDNKITEALSGVKDRYAALRELRNIVLVEDLFDKTPKPPLASISDSNLSDELCDDASSSNQAAFLTAEVADNNSLDNLPTYSVSWANDEMTSESIDNQVKDEEQVQQLEEDQDESNQEKLQRDPQNNTLSNKDDLEIDEYMNKAISELSLDQRISPNIQSKSPLKADDEDAPSKNITPSPLPAEDQKLSPCLGENQQKSSLPISLATSDVSQELQRQTSPPLNDKKVVEKDDTLHDDSREKTITPVKALETSESWAVFDDAQIKTAEKQETKPHISARADFESGSSDGKQEWKQREKAYHKRWPKPHTSSSSRDVSPWEDGPVNEQRKRHQYPSMSSHFHHSTERYARPAAPSRHRKDSLEGEYYDDYERRPPSTSRIKLSKSSVHRSKEILESENPNWYHGPPGPLPQSALDHWYPNEDENSDERAERMSRPFDRNAYERSTYGPPYDKREPRSYQGYDRNERRLYDKRSKYYRGYNRPDYESYDPYDMPPARGKCRKDYDEYEKSFERGARETRSAREYFYDKDRRSFDSNESYDSAGRMRRMNSGEIYGSYESGRNDYRDRYISSQGGRMSRRNQRSRGTIEDDSDEVYRENSGGSLQRQTMRSKHSNIKLDDDVWSSGGGNKYWKQRPSSATVASGGDKISGHSESDEEREKRSRRKTKQGRNKEIELRSNYATIRYSQQQQSQHSHQRRDYYDFEDDLNDFQVGDSRQADGNNSPSPRDYYARKKHSSGNIKAPSLTASSAGPRMVEKAFNEYSKSSARYSAQSYDDESEDDNFASESRMKKNLNFKKSVSKDMFMDDSKEHFSSGNFDQKTDENIMKKPLNSRHRSDHRSGDHFPQHHQESNIQTHGSNNSSSKFSVDGFESDFNSSPKQQQSQQQEQKVDANKFSFEDREFSISPNSTKNSSNNAVTLPSGSGGGIQQKLRFNENVSISKFDKNAASSSQHMFEDDFLQSWSPEISGSNSSVQMQSSLKKTTGNSFMRQDNIKKSDSINIFARKVDEDPFANDDFFNTEEEHNVGKANRDEREDPFQWDSKNNFANFDNDKNI